MAASTLEVITVPDGTLVLQPHALLADDDASQLRRVLIHAVRHVRPQRLVLDLGAVLELGPLSLGALAAACHVGDARHVTVLFDNCAPEVAALLTAAGVPTHRIRLK
ncbi:STAS domain-containing protein [Actinoplanes sp. NPDC023801]|uniref:STAS domain-containing protein n=1 Tax=Actinoplanes sp. NPDC023801 TaxID=3154595 RepID=UPI00340600C3